MPEIVIEANGVELCTEPFGDPTHPPILLIMGLGGSMLWWDDDLCHTLARAGHFVIRYDHRDTGRSTTVEPGRPDYGATDLVGDAVAVLDGHGLEAAHIVGVSAGGAIAQRLAIDAAQRVLSLTLISTSPVVPVDLELAPPTTRFDRFVSDATVDWSDAASVTEYLVGYARMLAGDERHFDEAACRELVCREAERADGLAAVQNHDLIAHDGTSEASLTMISAPTLVIHGTADPMFPVEHGRALAAEIADSILLELPGAGHGIDLADRDVIASAINRHVDAVRR